MLAIFAVLFALQATALTGPVLAQDSGEAEPRSGGLAALFVHRANRRAEREDDFFRAWSHAAEVDRERTARTLAELRSQGAPAEWRPDLGSLGVATWTLGGGDPELLLGENPAASLGVQALSVDLVVRPGAFRSTAPGERPENLVVRVWPLFELSEALDVTGRLIWIGPDGRESLAREEPIRASAFAEGGFDMYVRAPRSAPGIWQLVLELEPDLSELEGGLRAAPVGLALVGVVRSTPVPVPCIADLPKSMAGDQGLGRGPLEALLGSGLRFSGEATRLAREVLTGVPAAIVLAPSEVTVLLASPRDLAGGPTLAGIVGQTWRAATDARLVPFEPSAGGVEPRLHTQLAELPPGPKVVVLRGDTLLDVQLESLRFGVPDVDALVVLASAWRPTATLPAVPTLFLTSDGAAADLARELGAGRVEAQQLEFSPFLSELELPALVAAFLERHALGKQP